MQYTNSNVQAIKIILMIMIILIALITNIFWWLWCYSEYKEYLQIKEQPLYSWSESVQLRGKIVGKKFTGRKPKSMYYLLDDEKLGIIALRPGSMIIGGSWENTVRTHDEISVEGAFIHGGNPKIMHEVYGIKKLWLSGKLIADSENPTQRKKQISNQLFNIIILLVIGLIINALLYFLFYVARAMDLKHVSESK